MNRSLGILLSSLAIAAGPDTDGSESSRWHHNPRSRTEVAIGHQNNGDLEAAGSAFGTALELAPGDPLVQFNAGTASLLGGGEQAVELLQAAAQAAAPELQPLAYYNLGNAQVAAQALPEAIESYKQSLRLEPGNVDVKHNLELAQRMLQEQQEEQQQQDQEEQEQEQEQEQQEQEQQDPSQEQEQQQEQNPEQQDEQQQEQQQDSPLPDFEDQPDMTAEQAAAILEAVENLEREQRRKQAMEQLKRAKGDRDW